MRSATVLRSTAASVLSAAAAGLSVGSRVTSRIASLVRPGPHRSPTQPRAIREEPRAHAARSRDTAGDGGDPGDGASRGGVVRVPDTEPVPEAPSHVRTHETHVEELAARAAAEVIAVVPELSTDELGRLYEHEAANKKRKTVLAAVERAADPRAQPPGQGELQPDTVRPR